MNLESTLNRNVIFLEIVFKFSKIQTNRKLLTEEHHIPLKKIEYLQQILEYHRQGRKIEYTDESYVLT